MSSYRHAERIAGRAAAWACFLFVAASVARADVTWSGAASGSWTNGANWSGTPPGGGDTAIFNSTAYVNTPVLDSNTVSAVGGLQFGDGATAAAALTLGAVASATPGQKTSSAVASGSSMIPLVDASGLAVGQLVAGARIPAGTHIAAISSNEITLSQPTSGGTLNSGTQLTFTSVLQVGEGGLTVAAGIAAGQSITAPFVLTANQTWTVNSTLSTSIEYRGVGALGNRTLTLNGAATSNLRFPLSNALCGTGRLVVDTAGTIVFGGSTGAWPNNPFTGGVTLNTGTITISGGNTGNTGSCQSLGTGLLTINGGQLNGAGNIAGHPLTVSGQLWNADWTYLGSRSLDMGTGGISLGNTAGTTRTLTVNNSSYTLTLGGVITNGATVVNLTKAGTGNLRLNADNLYTGITTIAGGKLVLGNAGAITNSSAIAVAAGATFDVGLVSAGYAIVANQTLTGAGTVAGALTIATGGIVAPGSGLGTLTATGDLTFEAGSRLAIDASGAAADLLAVSGNATGTVTVAVQVTAVDPVLPLLIMTAAGIEPSFVPDLPEYITTKDNNNTELWLRAKPPSPATVIAIR